jgi:DNA polymerase-4
MPVQKTIFHIDFDSFFASVEQQNNKALRNRPIGVTATNGRTCIIASSIEAKRLGIKTGTRTYEAKKLCASVVFIPAHFREYLEVSKKFLNICKDFSPFVELFSIDEVFIDVSLTKHLFKDKYEIVTLIKKRIKEEIGEYITASFGISHNKLLAKLASGLNKPNGIAEISPEQIDNIYAKIKLTDICGIGEQVKDRLNKLKIFSALDLRRISKERLILEFGQDRASFLKDVSCGVDFSEVIPYTFSPEVKSVGRNYCLPKNEYDKRVLFQTIYELCEEIGIKLRKLDKEARTVGLSLKGNIDFKKQKTFLKSINTGKNLFYACKNILETELSFEEKFTKESYIRQLSIWTNNLTDKNISKQLDLFNTSSKEDSLTEAIDKINNRFGDHTIRNGFLLYSKKLTTEPNGYMADRYERNLISGM